MCEIIDNIVNEIKNTKITIEDIKYSASNCPDIVAGRNGVYWFNYSQRNKMKNNLDIDEGYDGLTIVIVLESPHKNEFKVTSKRKQVFTNGIVSSPALGNTGDKLQKYFTEENLEHLLGEYSLKNNEYRIILMNSIQYQCSLGQNPKVIRDYIWLKMWFEYGFNEEFRKRLKKYEPDVIINLCTVGNHKEEKDLEEELREGITAKYIDKCVGNNFDFLKESGKEETTLREIVSDAAKQAMKELNKEVLFYEGNHPSSWKPNFDTIKEA